MLTCQQITALVTDFLEGRMGLADRLRFQMHVGMCKHCRAYLKQMKVTVAALGQMPDDAEMPAEVSDELRKRFAAWHASRDEKKKPEPV